MTKAPTGKHLVYRALMPDHYLPRTAGTDPEKFGQMTDVDGSRKWFATQLPNLRVFGPLWSFGLVVKDLNEGEVYPAGEEDNARLFDLRALAASPVGHEPSPEKNPPLDQQASPVLFQARVSGVLQMITSDGTPAPASRLSTLALDTIPAGIVDEQGQVAKPITKGALPTELDFTPVNSLSPIFLRPFGDRFDRPDKGPETKPGEHLPLDGQYLPAMRLVHGRIRLTSTSAYLKKARVALGLADPGAEQEDGTGLVLLDDGFALRGKLTLPWRTDPVESWFRVGLGEDAAVGPFLTPWFDPDNPETAANQRGEWDKAFDELAVVIEMARTGDGKPYSSPRGLSLQVAGRIEAEDLSVPLEFHGGTPSKDAIRASILVHRPPAKDGNVVYISGRALVLRLADRPIREEPRSTLTVEPRRFELAPRTIGLRITAEVSAVGAAEELEGKVEVGYRFIRSQEREVVSLEGPTPGDQKTPGPISLAVPILQTAARLRKAMGLASPSDDPAANTWEPKARTVPWIWGFTPVRQGWLHWPLPNLTPQLLDDLSNQASSKPTAQPPRHDPTDGISGALIFGNFPDSPNFQTDHLAWFLSVAEPNRVRVEIDLYWWPCKGPAAEAEGAAISDATVTLTDPTLVLDGVLPLVPFRQSETRLLPDHADRALAVTYLPALSPVLLNDAEAEAWANDAARLSVDLFDCSIDLTKDGNLLSKETELQVEAKLHNLMSPDPWIWARHAALPTIQTLPMAVAGAAVRQPLEGRSLAPLRPAHSSAGYSGNVPFRFVLDTSHSELDLKTAKNTLGYGAFERPTPPAASWQVETGMAVTTLPSATIFPGVSGVNSTGPGLPLTGQTWNGITLSGARVELRHDLALGDEANATATPPPPPPPPPLPEGSATQPGKDAKLPPPDVVRFSPRPDNGPGDATEVAALVWTALDRKAALAALDQRDLLKGKDMQGASLAGLWHDLVISGEFKLDQKVAFIDNRLSSVGGWSIGKVSGAGLPSSEDHEGLHLEADAGKFPEIAHGSPVLPKSDAFTDQTGLRHAASSENDGSAADEKRVLLHTFVDGSKQQLRLVTLYEPVEVLGQRGLSFWCVDAPVDDPDAPHAKQDKDWRNAAAIGANLRNGYRWVLHQPETEDQGYVVIDDIAFEPLRLGSLRLTSANSLQIVEIHGRLRLPLEGHTLDTPPPIGKATLTLTPDPAGQGLIAQLSAENVEWPLSSGTGSGVVQPVLAFCRLPDQGQSTDASLVLTLGGRRWTWKKLELFRRAASENAGPVLWAQIDLPDPDENPPPVGQPKLQLKIFGPGGPHECKLELSLSATDNDLELRGKLGFDLRLGDDCVSAGKWLLLSRKRAVATLDLNSGDIALDPASGGFALTLSAQKGEIEGGLLDPARVLEGKVGFLAALEGKQVQGFNGAPAFGFRGQRLTVALRLEVPGQAGETLTLSTGRREPRRLHLTGRLNVANAFSWPQLTVTETKTGFERATVPATDTPRITHRATITFDGAPLQWFGGALICAATLRHVVSTDRQEISWLAHQHVRIWTAEAFKTALMDSLLPETVTKEGLRKLPTQFSPIGPGAPTDASKMTAVPHFLHVSAANPGGIRGKLAKVLVDALAKPQDRRFLALDISGHHALFPQGGTAGLSGHLVSLPALALLGSEGQKIAQDEAVARMLMSRPTTDQNLAQHVIDGLKGRTLSALAPAQRQRLTQIGSEFQKDAALTGRTMAEVALGDVPNAEEAFQPVVLVETGADIWRTADDLPGAGTAMHLSRVISALAQAPLLALRLHAPPYLSSRGLSEGKPNGLVDLKKPTDIQPERFLKLTALLRQDAVVALLPGPIQEPPVTNSRSHVLRLFVAEPSTIGPRLIAEATPAQTVNLKENAADHNLWASQSLMRLAPRASLGLLEDVAGRETRIVTVHGQGDGLGPLQTLALRPKATLSDSLAHPERQALSRPKDLLKELPALRELRDGFRPESVRPEALRNLPPSEADDDDPEVASAELSIAARLGKSPAALLSTESDLRFWMADRLTMAYRPFAEGDRLTFGIPKDFSARRPAALVPVRLDVVPPVPMLQDVAETPGPEDDPTFQPFLPARTIASGIAGRPGGITIRRAGLMVQRFSRIRNSDSTKVSSKVAVASEVPVHARQPRLPTLGRADRVRASAWEQGTASIGASQTALLHGPRAAPTIDRDAAGTRAAYALRIALASPPDGILAPRWGGRIRLRVDTVFGQSNGIDWEVEKLRISATDGTVLWRRAKKKDGAQPGSEGVLAGKVDATVELDLAEALPLVTSLPPATALRLELVLKATVGDLRRQLVFQLLTGAEGRAGPEQPVFLRFEDPEHDATLTGIPVTEVKESPYSDTSPTDLMILAVEATKARSGQRLALALALRSRAGEDPQKKFPDDSNRWPLLHLERQRRSLATQMELIDPTGTGLTPAGETGGYHLDGVRGEEETEAYFFLDLAEVTDAPSPTPVATDAGPLGLRPGDRLVVIIEIKGGNPDNTRIQVEIDIVETPPLPSNGSSFAALELRRDESYDATVRVLVHAARPEATLVELVDPADLLRGKLARRSSYLWGTFLTANDRKQRYLAVQKIGMTTASWLPAVFGDSGWQKVSDRSRNDGPQAKGQGVART